MMTLININESDHAIINPLANVEDNLLIKITNQTNDESNIYIY